MLPTAWTVLQSAAGAAVAADDWPQPDPADAVRRLADDAVAALS